MLIDKITFRARKGDENYLDVPLRLHEAAHDAKGHDGLVRFSTRQHGRYDRVVGPFVRRNTVAVARFQVEVVAPVLQREAAAGRNDAGAEAHVVAVDEATHVAVGVARAQVDRVGFFGERVAW